VGYNETSKACRVYIPSSKETVERRDIKFKEEIDFQKSYRDKDILEAKVPQQEELSFLQSSDLPT
jgi:hypothetical protein